MQPGNSGLFSSSEPFDLPETTPPIRGISECQLPPDPAADDLSEMIAWDNRQHVSYSRTSPPNLTTSSEQRPERNILDDEVCWFGDQPGWSEDLNPESRPFFPVRQDPLSNWSKAVKQTSKLAVNSWQILRGNLTRRHSTETQ
jgi:hypothetical protein